MMNKTVSSLMNFMSVLSVNTNLIYICFPFIVFSSTYFIGGVSTIPTQNTEPFGGVLTVTDKDEVIYEEIKTFLPVSNVPIQISQSTIPLSTKFLVVQVHSYDFNLTLSYNKTILPHYHVNGTNIGLVVPLVKDEVPELYVINFNISRNVSALVAVLAYGTNVPIPGGCNMVFSVETSPFMEISYNRAYVTVDFQPSSPPINSFEDCELAYVDLEMYHTYLPERDYNSESYFDGIRKMITVERIRKYGTKINDHLDGPRMRRIFSAYPGTGSVFAIIAIYSGENGEYSSAYVPSVTYACSTVLWADTCQVLTNTFAKVLCAIIFFVGFFMCICGHRFFQPQIFIHSFLMGGVVSFLLFSSYLQTGLYSLAIIFGVAFAVICLIFWHAFSWPLFHIVLVSLNIGFLLTSIVFYAGFGDLDIMVSDINYWTSFIVFVMFAPIVLIYMSNKACIVASGILGAYAIIIPIDHYIGSNLKFIILNTVRRATVPEFKFAVINPPFGLRDFSLTIVWFVLSVAGISIQLYLQRNRPPFPPPPRDFDRYCCLCNLSGCCPSNHSAAQVDERTPLLVDARIPSSTPPDGYDDVFEPVSRPSAPSHQLLISH